MSSRVKVLSNLDEFFIEDSGYGNVLVYGEGNGFGWSTGDGNGEGESWSTR